MVSAMELRSSALRGVAQRAETHLANLLEALPWGIAVVRGDHVLVANPHAVALLPGPSRSTFALVEAARMAREAPVIVPNGAGRPVRVSTRPITWDHLECTLVIVEPHSVSPAEPAVSPAEPTAPRELWQPMVDLGGGRITGFMACPAADADEAEVHRCLVRAVGALADWGEGRTELDTAIAMIALPASVGVDAGLVAFIDAVLRRARAHPRRLWLRVTPDGHIDGAALATLRRVGPRVMREGFGRREQPAVEIDGVSVDGVMLWPESFQSGDWGLVQTALSIARHRGMATLAGPVEDATTHERLRAVGCRWSAGPLYGGHLGRMDALARYHSPVRPTP